MSDPIGQRPRAWRKPLAVAASTALAVAGLSLFAAAPASAAPALTITVDTLAFNAQTLPASANPSSCVDKETPAHCSLQAALAYANAIPAGYGQIQIVFDSSLNGLITDTAANTGQMAPNAPGSAYPDSGFSGADFVVNAANPVTIDFGNSVGFTDTYDSNYNGFDIKSNNVTLQNFTNISTGEAGIFIEAVSGTTITNGQCHQTASAPAVWGLETCVEFDTNNTASAWAKNTTISNFAMYDPAWTGIGVDSGTQIDGLTLSNVSLINNLNPPYFWESGSNTTINNVAMTGVSDTVPSGKPTTGYVIYPYSAFAFTNFSIDNSTFTGMRGGIINQPGTGAFTNLSVTNSTFNKVGQVWDDPVGAIKNMTWTGNTFENGTTNGPWWQGVFHMDEGTYTNANISNNLFKDNTQTSSGDIMFQQPGGSGNVIANNTFTRAGNTYQYQNAIRNYVVAASPTTNSGWSVLNNSIDGYGQTGNAYAPIWDLGSGIMKTSGNTFSPNTNGTTNATNSEGGQLWFLANTGGGANNNIQTLRPANAVFDGTNVTFQVAPVNPVVGTDANKQPTANPVSLGVFWTANSNAEVYLGQIDNVSSTATSQVSIPTTKTGGFIRVQTIQPDGTSSQYSGLAQVTVNLAAPVITGPTGGSSGSGGTTIAGTGAPGDTVTVTDTTTNSTVCTSVVDGSGNWSCTPSTPLTQGVHSLQATQTDGTNISPASNTVNFTSDGTPLFASAEVALGTAAVLGLGAGWVLLRRRRNTARA